jgi:hypothetical protein
MADVRKVRIGSEPEREEAERLKSLLKHGQVKITEEANPVLGPGQTHVLNPTTNELREVRKSLFRR